MPSNHLVLCYPLLFLPSIFTSIKVFSSELALHIRWPKHWSFSFSISPSNEYSGLISFRIDWFDLLSVQGTHRSLLQHHSSKALILCLTTALLCHFLQLSSLPLPLFFLSPFTSSHVTESNFNVLETLIFFFSFISSFKFCFVEPLIFKMETALAFSSFPLISS